MSKDNHPDFDSLFRYSEDAMSPAERTAFEDHLKTCDLCRLELFRIRNVHGGADAPEPPPVSDLLDHLAHWKGSVAQPESGEALKRRVESELVPYVGITAACRILERVAASGENLLDALDTALRPLLGKSASSLLISRIVDRAVMRP